MPRGIYKRKPFTEEHRKHLKESHLKNPTRYWLGKKRPELKKIKGWGFQKGQKNPYGTRFLGKKHSEETKKKMMGRKHSEKTKEKIRKATFEYAKKVNGFICPKIGRNEIQLLDKLEQKLKYRIIRQFQCGGYYLDGYIPEINLAIEIDEKQHKNTKEKDIKREEFIKQKLGCQFLRIKDYD